MTIFGQKGIKNGYFFSYFYRMERKFVMEKWTGIATNHEERKLKAESSPIYSDDPNFTMSIHRSNFSRMHTYIADFYATKIRKIASLVLRPQQFMLGRRFYHVQVNKFKKC